jgi:hypothetical protein
MSVIVHVGYPKTATTWLQDEYFPKIDNFDYLVDRWLLYRLIFESDSFLFNPEETRAIIKSNLQKENIILSSELLTTSLTFGWHYGNYSIACANKLKRTYPNAKIVIFIRRQQSLICSSYQQYVKNGGTFGFKKWLYSGKVFRFEHLLFDMLIDYYTSLFGSNNVKVYLYEDFKNNNQSFLERFNKDLGLEVDLKKVNFNPINKGLRVLSMPLMKMVNHFYKKPIGCKRYICHIPGMTLIGKGVVKYLNPMPIFGRYFREDDFLKPKDLEYIKNFYSKHNQNLIKYVRRDDLEKFGYFL